jgi:hypothetical protein
MATPGRSATYFDGKVLRVDRRTGRVVARVPGDFTAADLAVGLKAWRELPTPLAS